MIIQRLQPLIYRVVLRLLATLLLVGSQLVLAATPQEALEAALSNWVAGQAGVTADQVKMVPLDPRVQVQPCGGSFSFDYPFVNKESVRARCNKPAWQIFVKVGLTQQQQEMVVANRDIAPGQALKDTDLDVKTVAAPAAGSFSEKSALVGRQLKRPLAKGQPVMTHDLEKGQKAVRAKFALKAGDLMTESAIERIDLAPGAGGSSPVWIPNEIMPGTRLGKNVAAGQIIQTTDLAENRQVVVATGNLNVGQVLKPELLKLERLDAEKINRTHLFDLSGLEGSELMRPIRAGEAIRTSDLRPALLVKKGDLVTFVIGRPTEFMITVKVEALQDGRLNEQIKLRNPESGHTFSGVITGKGTAKGV
jgi:flagella basal body P-ring formation protein FlgA